MATDRDFPDYPCPGGWDLIPSHMHGGVYRFVMNGVVPGRFLCLLLEDAPFSEVAAAADSVNLHQLGNWAKFLYNYVPNGCRRDGFSKWITSGGILGLRKETPSEVSDES